MSSYTFPKRSSGALGDLAGLAEMFLHVSLLVWKEKSTLGVGFITSGYETWTGPMLTAVGCRLFLDLHIGPSSQTISMQF